MSALIALMQDENLTAVFENVFMESAAEILAGLSDEDLEKVAKYVALLKEKQVRPATEEGISEALVPILEYNAALYGTFLYESVEDEFNEEESKKLLEVIRERFGSEFIIEAMSDKAKGRLKKAAKIAGGVGAAGAAGAAGIAAFKNKDELGDYAKKAGSAIKKFVSGDTNDSDEMKKSIDAAEKKVRMASDSDAMKKSIDAAKADSDPGARTAPKLSPKDSGPQTSSVKRTGSDAGEAAKARIAAAKARAKAAADAAARKNVFPEAPGAG